MDNLFDPPPCFGFPLSKGGGQSVDFQNNPSDDGETFVDYDVGAVVTLVIDADPVIEAEAEVTDYHAVVTLTPEQIETVTGRVAWRLLVETPTSTVPLVAAEGMTWWTNDC